MNENPIGTTWINTSGTSTVGSTTYPTIPLSAESDDKPPADPVRVDGTNRLHGDDALEGHFVKVIDGEHAGRVGSFEKVLEHDPSTGQPTNILVRTRDADSLLLSLPYEHVEHTDFKGGR